MIECFSLIPNCWNYVPFFDNGFLQTELASLTAFTAASAKIEIYFKNSILLTLTLVSLFAESPKKLLAESAEGGLTKKFGQKPVTFDIVNPEIVKSKYHF